MFIKMIILNLKPIFSVNLREFSAAAHLLNGIYILSAVRTPVGVLKEFSTPQLCAVVLKEALERSVIPSRDIQNIFMANTLQDRFNEQYSQQTLSLAGFSKTTISNLKLKCSMESFIEANQLLLEGKKNICIVMGSSTNLSHLNEKKSDSNTRQKYMREEYTKLKQAHQNGAFEDEIAKLVVRKKGEQLVVAEDSILQDLEVQTHNEVHNTASDGAAAVVIATDDYITENHLTPLAKIISFAGGYENSLQDVVNEALKKADCGSEEMERWEVEDMSQNFDSCINHFNIDCSLVNKDGGIHGLVGLSGTRVLCHLVHSLSSGRLGCAVVCDTNGNTSAVIIKKVQKKFSGKPQLRLYTKHPCPLCDELKIQIKPFEERFSLEEVDIEAEENKKFKMLYRYEIPVLFLDGVFLCKHKVDIDHFKLRLLKSEKARLEN